MSRISKIGRMIPSNLIASPQRTRKRAARLQRPASARPCSLRVEQLEDRVTPSVNPLTPLQLQGDVFSITAHDWNQVWIDAGSPNAVNATGKFDQGSNSAAVAGGFTVDATNTTKDFGFTGGGSKDIS